MQLALDWKLPEAPLQDTETFNWDGYRGTDIAPDTGVPCKLC